MGWLTGWQYRKSHIINPSEGAGTDYQIRIIVHYGSGTDSGEHVYLNGKCREDFGDIRFTKDDGVTLLSYWIEEKVDGDYAIFWVKITEDLSTDSVMIYVYYGNSDAVYDGNPEDVFILFDHFDGDVIDTNKWEGEISGFLIGNSILSTNQDHVDLIAKNLNLENCCIETKWRVNNQSYGICLGIRIGTVYDPHPDGYYGALRAGAIAKKIQIRKYSAGSSTSIASRDTMNYTPSTWTRAYMTVYGNTLRFKASDVDDEISTSDTQFTQGSISLSVFANSSGAGLCEWDWVAVRKYVEPEPSHGDWGSEEIGYILKISGYCYDYNGNPVPNATVWLFRTSDKVFIAETTSNEDGYYEFIVEEDTEYFLRAHKDGTPNIFGTTDRNIRPEKVYL